MPDSPARQPPPRIVIEQAGPAGAGGRPAAQRRGGGAPTPPPPPRIVIEQAGPAVAGGRHAAKRCVGDAVTVTAQVFRDGHDLLRAVAAARPTGDDAWREAPMAWIDRHVDGDTWAGEVVVDA